MMQTWIRRTEPLTSEKTMLHLRAALPEVLGRPVRTFAVKFLDQTAADFFAVEESGALHGVRWIEPEDMEVGFLDLMHDLSRMQSPEMRRRLLRMMNDETKKDPGLIGVILAAAEVPDRWREAAAGIIWPVRFVRAAAAGAAGMAESGLIFELLEPVGAGVRMSRTAAGAPETDDGGAIEQIIRELEAEREAAASNGGPADEAREVDDWYETGEMPTRGGPIPVTPVPNGTETEAEPESEPAREAAPNAAKAEPSSHSLPVRTDLYGSLSPEEVSAFEVLEELLAHADPETPLRK